MKAITEIEIKIGGQIRGFNEVGEGTYSFVIQPKWFDKRLEVVKNVGGRLLGFTEVDDGNYSFVIEKETLDKEPEKVTDALDDVFVLIEASKLSLDDEFMQYVPKSDRDAEFKELLTNVIRSGIKDFYRPKYDPSFNTEGTGVSFKAGELPAVFKSYNWWQEVAKKFMPKRYSRLGTRSEYVAFLGVLIKQLVAEGWSIGKAWNAVCHDSRELGHYKNSENAKHDFEKTGSRGLCGFYDLANTRKFLSDDPDDSSCYHWLVGGYYNNHSMDVPLASMAPKTDRYFNFRFGVGWIVLPLK